MAFLTPEEFSTIYVTASATEVNSDQITECLENAIDELTAWCGEAAVQFVQDATGTDDIKVRRFRRAQGKLAMRELLQMISSRFRSGGIQVSEKDLNDSAVNTYEKFSETEARLEVLWSDAKKSVEAYLLPAEEIPDETTGFINFSTTLSRKPVW